MGKRFLLDTNPVIYYLNDGLPEKAESLKNGEAAISFITQIELLALPKITVAEETAVQDFLQLVDIITIDQDIIAESVRIRKEQKIKLPDAIITATCLFRQLTLISANTKDFQKIERLLILNPFEL